MKNLLKISVLFFAFVSITNAQQYQKLGDNEPAPTDDCYMLVTDPVNGGLQEYVKCDDFLPDVEILIDGTSYPIEDDIKPAIEQCILDNGIEYFQVTQLNYDPITGILGIVQVDENGVALPIVTTVINSDTNTTYTLTMVGDVLTLVGSDGSTSPVTIVHPADVYNVVTSINYDPDTGELVLEQEDQDGNPLPPLDTNIDVPVCEMTDTIIYGDIDTVRNCISAIHYDYNGLCEQTITNHTYPAKLSLPQFAVNYMNDTTVCSFIVDLSDDDFICQSGDVDVTITDFSTTTGNVILIPIGNGKVQVIKDKCCESNDFESGVVTIDYCLEANDVCEEVCATETWVLNAPPSGAIDWIKEDDLVAYEVDETTFAVITAVPELDNTSPIVELDDITVTFDPCVTLVSVSDPNFSIVGNTVVNTSPITTNLSPPSDSYSFNVFYTPTSSCTDPIVNSVVGGATDGEGNESTDSHIDTQASVPVAESRITFDNDGILDANGNISALIVDNKTDGSPITSDEARTIEVVLLDKVTGAVIGNYIGCGSRSTDYGSFQDGGGSLPFSQLAPYISGTNTNLNAEKGNWAVANNYDYQGFNTGNPNDSNAVRWEVKTTVGGTNCITGLTGSCPIESVNTDNFDYVEVSYQIFGAFGGKFYGSGASWGQTGAWSGWVWGNNVMNSTLAPNITIEMKNSGYMFSNPLPNVSVAPFRILCGFDEPINRDAGEPAVGTVDIAEQTFDFSNGISAYMENEVEWSMNADPVFSSTGDMAVSSVWSALNVFPCNATSYTFRLNYYNQYYQNTAMDGLSDVLKTYLIDGGATVTVPNRGAARASGGVNDLHAVTVNWLPNETGVKAVKACMDNGRNEVCSKYELVRFCKY